MKTLRRFALAIAALTLLLLGTSLPAAAGTTDDPEIEGDCARATGAGASAAPEYEICRAWFTTVTGAPGEVAAVQTTIELGGDYEGRQLPSYVTVGWKAGDGCAERWSYGDTLGEGASLTLFRKCPGDDHAQELRLDLDAAQLARDRVTVTIAAADLAALGGELSPGSVLAAPTAGTSVLLRAPGWIVVEAAAGGARAGPGRDYVVDPGPAD